MTMNGVLRAAALAGIFGLNGLVACGDDSDGDGGGPEAGAAGAPRGGSLGTAGALIAGAPSAGRGGAPLGGSGGAQVSTGGAGAGGDEPTAGAGGVSGAAGAPWVPPGDGGAGVSGAGGAAGDGGTSGGGTSDPGGVGGGGSSGDPGGLGGGAGGEGGSAAACGDGVLEPGESCCTPDWVEARAAAAASVWAASAIGEPQCLAPRSVTGGSVCNTAACEGGATGCRVDVTDSEATYSSATSTVEGTMDMSVRGRIAVTTPFGTTGCNFVAYFDDMQYTAEVIKTVSPERLELGIGTPEVDPDPVFDWGTCAAGPTLEALLLPTIEQQIKPAIQAQLVDTLKGTERCPY